MSTAIRGGQPCRRLTPEPIDRVQGLPRAGGGLLAGRVLRGALGPRKSGRDLGAGRGDFDAARIRAVTRVLDAAAMREELRVFLEKAGAYTLTPMSQMLRLCHPCAGAERSALDAQDLPAGPGSNPTG